MHIQHVVSDHRSRPVSRFIWLCEKSLKVDHSLFVISRDYKVWLHPELRGLRFEKGHKYSPYGNPDCVMLHSVKPEHIKNIPNSTICVQENACGPPVYGVHAIALSRIAANAAGIADYVLPCGTSNASKKSSDLTIGLVESDCEADFDEGAAVCEIANQLPRASFILPYGSESFRAMSAMSASSRTSYRRYTESIGGSCDICLFPGSKFDPNGDLVAGCILSGAVPVVSRNGAHKEFVPCDELTYTTYHQAIKICCRLGHENGFLEKMRAECNRFYEKHLQVGIFRRAMVSQISRVVAVAGEKEWM